MIISARVKLALFISTPIALLGMVPGEPEVGPLMPAKTVTLFAATSSTETEAVPPLSVTVVTPLELVEVTVPSVKLTVAFAPASKDMLPMA